MMPLLGLAARRASRKAEVSPLLVPEWRGRERSGEVVMHVVKMGDMHCSTGSECCVARPDFWTGERREPGRDVPKTRLAQQTRPSSY